jgi:(S)-ureidoglycine aminohydrolase
MMRPHQFPVAAGHIPPGAIGHNRGVVRQNYAFMPPEGVLVSRLPQFERTIGRILTAPVMGARFAQYVLEIEPGGGTRQPFREDGIQHFYYVLSGQVRFAVDSGPAQALTPGGFAYVPAGAAFSLRNDGPEPARVLALRKRYEAIGLPAPEPIISHRDAVPVTNHTGLEGRGFQFLLPYGDMRFDFEMNLMWFKPGTCFPDVETHVMEHGLYMLEGQGLYFLGTEWHEIWAQDFIWMGGYCPQQFYPAGFGDACYLLYKNVNRDVAL